MSPMWSQETQKMQPKIDKTGLLALNAPQELCILGEGDDIPTLTGDIYKIRGKAESVVTRPGLAEGLKWLE